MRRKLSILIHFLRPVDSDKAERQAATDMSFLLAQMKELKKTSTPDQTYPLYGTDLTVNHRNR